jgi:NAD(P)-dependent dehydrogenase (short-subunit alcohol dehydrogenase family)
MMKTVLITGGNRGIGLEIGHQLDQKGFRVILGCRDIEAGAKAIKGWSTNTVVLYLDVTLIETIEQLYNQISKNYGHLDILINNAGISEYPQDHGVMASIKKLAVNYAPTLYSAAKQWTEKLMESKIVRTKHTASNVSMEDVKSVMETNLFGVWRVIQWMIPLLKTSDDPRIINISSGMGQLSNLSGYYPAYSLSKASLNALTIMFSKELKQDGIKVNAMCPGWVKTDMGGPNAPRTVHQGADTAIWLATEPNIPTGMFFNDRNPINW